MDRVTPFLLPIVLVLSLYFEVIFFHFPFFLLMGLVVLFFSWNYFQLIFIFILSLILDSLMVQPLGVTSLFVFVFAMLSGRVIRTHDFRGRFFLFTALLLTSFFYSMVVGYLYHFGMYILFIVCYFGSELYFRRATRRKTLLWG